jgi:hypothetical protein
MSPRPFQPFGSIDFGVIIAAKAENNLKTTGNFTKNSTGLTGACHS